MMNLVRVSNGAGVGTVPNFDIFAWCFLPREFLELAQTNSKAQGLGSLVAAVSGIAQSRTRLKRLNSSGSSNSKALICARLLQPCPILCNPMDCSLPGSSIHGILQARILEWVGIPFSRGSS